MAYSVKASQSAKPWTNTEMQLKLEHVLLKMTKCSQKKTGGNVAR